MKSIKQQYEVYWRQKASSYDSGFSNEIFESITPLLKKGHSLLDVGCGNGDLYLIAEPNFDMLFGCDISETALQKSLTKGMKAVCVDLNRRLLPFRDGSFDTITCLEVIEHVIDPSSFLEEIWRILSKNGQLIMTTPNTRYFKNVAKLVFRGKFPHTTTDTFVLGGGHFHYFTRKDLALLYRQTGFSSIKFHINQRQFRYSVKRRFMRRLIGNSSFGEWFCGGIIVEAFK